MRMTVKQSIKMLEKYNKWRRGGKGKMPDPVEIGIAIDTAIEALKKIKDYESI